MRVITHFNLIIILIFFIGACSGGSEKASGPPGAKELPKTVAEAEKNYKDYKGVGPISSLSLPAEIDTAMASSGKQVFDLKCTACHKTDAKFIGPAPKGILDRRTPEWVMNMILNPDQMVIEDHLAKLLLMEYNGSPMANQNLTEEEARAVLEYFRTL